MTKENKSGPMIPIACPSTGKDEWNALWPSIESGWLTQGPKVKEFESLFAEHHHVKFARASTNCTTALHLALMAIGIHANDEVIVPAFTWVATANVVLYCGARPIFVDVSRDSYNIDPGKIRAAITPKTRAVIPVHLFGRCADMDEIRNALSPHEQIKIIEDAACAAGAAYGGESAGRLGDLGAFSFHPRKILTTGEGGMVTTNNEAWDAKIKILRDHGAEASDETRHKGKRPYDLGEFKMLGFNYRMTDLQAAIGIVQLSKLKKFIQERQMWAQWYSDKLSGIPWLKVPEIPAKITPNWQSFVCRVDLSKTNKTRDEILEGLFNKGISCRPGTHAVTELAFYREKFRIPQRAFPIARELMETTIALPLSNRMREEDYARVVAAIRSL